MLQRLQKQFLVTHKYWWYVGLTANHFLLCYLQYATPNHLPLSILLVFFVVTGFGPLFLHLYIVRRYTAGYPSRFDIIGQLPDFGIIPAVGLFIVIACFEEEIQKLAREYPDFTPKRRLVWFDAKAKTKRVMTVVDDKPVAKLWKQTSFDPAVDTKGIV